MLPSLIDNRGGQQFRGIKVADGESFKPSLLPAREALQLRSSRVPQLDVHPVGAALAEKDDRHRDSLAKKANKRQNIAKIVAILPMTSEQRGKTQAAEDHSY